MQLVLLSAMLRRAAIFQCAACGHEVLKYNVGGAIEEPAKCPEASCGKTWTMQLMHNYSDYNDKQLVKMQVRGSLLRLASPTTAAMHLI